MLRTLYISGALLLLTFHVVGQLPLPCANFQGPFAPNIGAINGTYSTLCFELAPGSPGYYLSDPTPRTIQTLEGHVTQEFHYVPQGEGEMNVVLSPPGSQGEMEGAWYAPADNYIVPLYEKVEWGIQLPEVVRQAIDNWVYNDQHPTATPLSPTINPFNPEEIDIWADIHYGNEYYRANGFYYVPFERHTVYTDAGLDDPDDWYWQQLTTPHPFRIRYAPVAVVQHTVAIHCRVPGMGTWHIESFRFDVGGNSLSKSYVKRSSNNHYLVTEDNEIFFPVGMNINTLTYGCACDNVSNGTTCVECYDQGENDPCCGVSTQYQMGNWFDPEGLRRQCVPMAGYLKFDQVREELVANGATAFKFINETKMFDIEFEKLNNYYDRQYQAWEMDRVFEDCADKNLHFQWSLQLQLSYTYRSYGDTRWDWASGDIYGHPKEGLDFGWCYQTDLQLDTPLDFLTNPEAKKEYKKKLRYLLARYGYSTQVYSIELLSEINGIAKGNNYICDDTDNDGECEGWPHFNDLTGQWVDTPEITQELTIKYSPYDTDPTVWRPAVYQWHQEISTYIKQELGHRRHLLAAHYTGQAPTSAPPAPYEHLSGVADCNNPYFDNTWNIESIDILSISKYANSFRRYEDFVNEYSNNRYQCGVHVQQSMTKPVLYGENGSGRLDMDLDNTNFIMDMYMSAFSGHASSGMHWGHSKRRDQWFWFGKLDQFLQEKFFSSANPQSEAWAPVAVESTDIGSGANNGKVLMVGMREGQSRAIGVIYNRTWNWVTQCPECPSHDPGLVDDLIISLNQNYWPMLSRTFENVGASDHALKFPDFAGLANYEITYFDPLTLEQINQENDITQGNGRLKMKGYPLLTASRPFVLFRIRKLGTSFMPTSEFEAAELNEKRLVMAKHSAASITPNPTLGNFSIQLGTETHHTVQIRSTLGAMQYEANGVFQSLDIDASRWSAGVYFIFIDNSNPLKLVKQ
jgi:hypothetical protein